jgi:hypothetical protein
MLWLPQTGDIAKFTVDPETGEVSEKVIINMPPAANGPAPEFSTEATTPARPSRQAWRSHPMAASSTWPSRVYTLGVINTSTDNVRPRHVLVSLGRDNVVAVHKVHRSLEKGQGIHAATRVRGPSQPLPLNRFDWYSAHDWKVAYLGDPKVYMPDEVPGKNRPPSAVTD